MSWPRLGHRQEKLLRLALLHHGGLAAAHLVRHRLTRQGCSLAARGLVSRTETGSVTLTADGRETAEHLWSRRR